MSERRRPDSPACTDEILLMIGTHDRAGIDRALVEAGLLAVTGDGRGDLLLRALPAQEGTVPHARVVLGAAGMAHLRRALPAMADAGRASEIVLVVLDTVRPDLLAPSSERLEGLGCTSFSKCLPGRGRLVARTTFARPVGVVDGAAALLAPKLGHPSTALGLRVAVGNTEALAWAAGDGQARLSDEAHLRGQPDDIQPFDVGVGFAGISSGSRAAAGTPLLRIGTDHAVRSGGWAWLATAPYDQLGSFAGSAFGLVAEHRDWVPPVDSRVISPMGFASRVGRDRALLRVRPDSTGQVWELEHPPGQGTVHLDARVGLGEAAINALRGYRVVDISSAGAHGPVALATLLAGLACAGIPFRPVEPVPALVRTFLEPISSWVDGISAETADDDVEREAWSVRLRRQALSFLSVSARWRSHATRLDLPVAPAPSVSVVLPTRRPENLGFAVEQIRRQTWSRLELVLAVHGIPRDHPALLSALRDYDRPYRVVEVDERRLLGEVLNAAVDQSSGDLIAKMDDDDWYSPRHVEDLVLARDYSGAMLLGLSDRFIFVESANTTVRTTNHRTEGWASRLAGGTLLIAKDDLASVGRWRAVPRAVDRLLIESVRSAGGRPYAIHDLGYCLYRGVSGHTWNPGDAHFLRDGRPSWPGFFPPPMISPVIRRRLGP